MSETPTPRSLTDALDPASQPVTDWRIVRRALTSLRERVQLQDDEIDTLRATIRSLQQQRPVEMQPAMPDLAMATRVADLETQALEHNRSIQTLRQVTARNEANLQRLVTEMDRLVTQMARRPDRVFTANPAEAPPDIGEFAPGEFAPGEFAPGEFARPASSHRWPPPEPGFEDYDAETEGEPFRWKIPALIFTVLVVLLTAGWLISRQFTHPPAR